MSTGASDALPTKEVTTTNVSVVQEVVITLPVAIWRVGVRSTPTKLRPRIVTDEPPNKGAFGASSEVTTGELNVNNAAELPAYAPTVRETARLGPYPVVLPTRHTTLVPVLQELVEQSRGSCNDAVVDTSLMAKLTPERVRLKPPDVGPFALEAWVMTGLS